MHRLHPTRDPSEPAFEGQRHPEADAVPLRATLPQHPPPPPRPHSQEGAVPGAVLRRCCGRCHCRSRPTRSHPRRRRGVGNSLGPLAGPHEDARGLHYLHQHALMPPNKENLPGWHLAAHRQMLRGRWEARLVRHPLAVGIPLLCCFLPHDQVQPWATTCPHIPRNQSHWKWVQTRHPGCLRVMGWVECGETSCGSFVLKVGRFVRLRIHPLGAFFHYRR